jgi:hypothetical protein
LSPPATIKMSMNVFLVVSASVLAVCIHIDAVMGHVAPYQGEGWIMAERTITIAPGGESQQMIFCTSARFSATACGCQLMTSSLADIRLVSNSAWSPFGAAGTADRCGCYWHNYGTVTRTLVIRLQAHCDLIDHIIT